MRPFLAREGGFLDLHHRPLRKRNVGPLHVVGIPDVEQGPHREPEQPRGFILRPFQEHEPLLEVVPHNLHGVAVARFKIEIGVELEPHRDRPAPAAVVVFQRARVAVGGTRVPLLHKVQAPAKPAAVGDQLQFVVDGRRRQPGPLLHVAPAVTAGEVGLEPPVERGVQREAPGQAGAFLGIGRRHNLASFLGTNLADKQVLPADLSPMCLQVDGPLGGNRLTPRLVVLERRVIDHEFPVEPDPRPGPHLPNAEPVPLAKRAVGLQPRIATGGPGGVVE